MLRSDTTDSLSILTDSADPSPLDSPKSSTSSVNATSAGSASRRWGVQKTHSSNMQLSASTSSHSLSGKPRGTAPPSASPLGNSVSSSKRSMKSPSTTSFKSGANASAPAPAPADQGIYFAYEPLGNRSKLHITS